MASGCTIGHCPVCEELIWEDEWDMVDDVFIHDKCKVEYVANNMRISKGQFRALSREEQIKRDIKELKNDMKKSFDYYLKELNRLENLLNNNLND